MYMNRAEFIKILAEHFGIEPNEDGEYDLNDYEWRSGCSFAPGIWLSLANIVYCFDDYFDED